METTIVCWGYTGIIENEMETAESTYIAYSICASEATRMSPQLAVRKC